MSCAYHIVQNSGKVKFRTKSFWQGKLSNFHAITKINYVHMISKPTIRINHVKICVFLSAASSRTMVLAAGTYFLY